MNVPIMLEIGDTKGSPKCGESLLRHPRMTAFRLILD